jgi:hypothetical protein
LCHRNNLTQTFDDMWRIDLRKVSECFYGPDTMTNVDVPWEPIPTGAVHPEPQIGHVIAPLGSRRFILFGGRNVHGHKMISGTRRLWIFLFDCNDIVDIQFICRNYDIRYSRKFVGTS